MSLSQPTLEDIWKLFQETDRLIKASSLESEKRFEETERFIEEAERRREESELAMRKFHEESERRREESERRREESDRRREESERRREEGELALRKLREETEREIQKANASIARLGSKLGDYVEEMVRPAAVRLFRERGIDVHEVHQNVTSKRGNDGIEVDLLVVNDSDVIAIECKSTLGIDDVKEHLERLAKLKRLLPSYAGKRVMGAVTGMVLPDNVAQFAYRQGLFVIAQTGENLAVRNDHNFKPTVW
jgi:hypothetical protein